MEKFFKLIIAGITLLSVIMMISCSDDDNPSSPQVKPTILNVLVKSGLESIVENSNVVVYDAETSQAVTRDFTDINGVCNFELNEGNYYLNVTAQDYDPSPAPNIAAVPFFVAAEDTTFQERHLNENPAADTGYLTGNITPVTNNFLVVIENTSDQKSYSTYSGPDGFFIIYNVSFGSYNTEAFKAGYEVTEYDPSGFLLSETNADETVEISVNSFDGYSISGKVDFRATEDSSGVDIVLRDPRTMSVVPGLTTRTYLNVKQENGSYFLDNIPSGDFIAWASLENDGYVLDPDWLFQNPDGLDLSFQTDDAAELDFPVTGAIQIDHPTNPSDSIYAFVADSIVPTFSWTVTSSCSSRKEWFIEVTDINGNRIWGGFNSDGSVEHAFIGPETISVEYDFDGTASQDLVPGEVYQWRIWADGGTNLDSYVQQLISASEDLRGIFTVPEE